MPYREGGPQGNPNENREQNKNASTLYDALGVKENSSQEFIQSAFRIKAKHCHPDKFGEIATERGIKLKNTEDEEKFKKQLTKEFQELQNVYDILSDPNKRVLYDQQLSEARQKQKEEAEQEKRKQKAGDDADRKRRENDKKQEKTKQEKEEQDAKQTTQKETNEAGRQEESEKEKKREKEDPKKMERVEQRRGMIFVGIRVDDREVLVTDAKGEKTISRPFDKIEFTDDDFIKGIEKIGGKDFYHLLHPSTGDLITGQGKNMREGISYGFKEFRIERVEVKRKRPEENETEEFIMGIMTDEKKVKLYKLADYEKDMGKYRKGK